MSLTLEQVAKCVSGQLITPRNFDGSDISEIQVSDALPLQEATAGTLTLIDDQKHIDRVNASDAAAVIAREQFDGCNKPIVLVADLHAAFTSIVQTFRPKWKSLSGVHQSAVIDASATLGTGVTVGPGATIGAGCEIGDHCTIAAGVHIAPGCVVGDDCQILPNAVLYENTRVGNRVLIHAGAVLGGYGFGYRQENGQHIRTSQLGWVEIEDDVEIGAVATIDRGTYGSTRIGEGTKLDNQVQIGHNCQIGKHNLLCSQVGIAGSTTTGDYVVLAGQAGVADHLRLEDRVVVTAQSGVMHNLEAGKVVFGTPASPIKQKMQEVALCSKLPQMRKDLRALTKTVDALTAPQDTAPQEADADTTKREAA